MRYPDRIPRILAKLDELRRRHPDQRLGELVENLTSGETDTFYFDDDHMEQRLDSVLADGWATIAR
jgi:hypothetical protein